MSYKRRKISKVELSEEAELFFVRCVDYSNCFTQGVTKQEAIENIKEVIHLILDVPQNEIALEIWEKVDEAVLVAS